MLQLFCPKETHEGETRVALTPETAKRLVGLGVACTIESQAGRYAGFTDDDYRAAGATVAADRNTALAAADIVASVQALDNPAGIKQVLTVTA